MKLDRHGQAKVLSQEELHQLFTHGLRTNRDRALFGICLYTACRINEACTLRTTDAYERLRVVRPEIVFRKGNTKGQLSTRCIPVIEDLRRILLDYYPSPRTWFLFPSQYGQGHLHPESASRIFRQACSRVGLIGASTHSFRRTALTEMSNAGIPLRVIQEISGHRNLEQLQKYLEVKPEQIRGAVAALSMLTPVKKDIFPDSPLSIQDNHPPTEQIAD
jgi:integrase/recombinase XerD